ncbi:unnamed protein product [Penicillium salamii]|nr:unnamed protein product [Penicillium salamii]
MQRPSIFFFPSTQLSHSTFAFVFLFSPFSRLSTIQNGWSRQRRWQGQAFEGRQEGEEGSR